MSTLHFSASLVLIISLFSSVTFAGEDQSNVGALNTKPTDEDLYAIGQFGCTGAEENDFKRYTDRMERHKLKTPDAKDYYKARCDDGNLILQNTLMPGSDLFLKNFIIDVYEIYGEEEVKAIINVPDRIRGYTLLEEALFLNECKEKSTRTGLNEIIYYLRRVGGKVREGFCKI